MFFTAHTHAHTRVRTQVCRVWVDERGGGLRLEFGVEIGSSGPYLRLGFFGVRFRPALDSGSFGLHGYALHCDCCTSWPCMVPVECGAPPRTHTCRFMPHGMRHSVCGAMCGSCVSGSGSCVMRCRWRSGDACRWRYDICRSGYGFMEPLPGGWVHLRARSRGGLPPPKDTCSSRWGVSPPPNLSSFPPCNPRAGGSAG